MKEIILKKNMQMKVTNTNGWKWEKVLRLLIGKSFATIEDTTLDPSQTLDFRYITLNWQKWKRMMTLTTGSYTVIWIAIGNMNCYCLFGQCPKTIYSTKMHTPFTPVLFKLLSHRNVVYRSKRIKLKIFYCIWLYCL